MILTETSDVILDQLVKKLGIKGFIGVHSCDRLQKLKSGQWEIINMQGSDEGNRQGTHWVFLSLIGNKYLYFDPFGFPPENRVIGFCRGKDIIYNTAELQDLNSTSCGYWCLMMAYCLFKKKIPFIKTLSHFQYRTTKENERILTHFFNTILFNKK